MFVIGILINNSINILFRDMEVIKIIKIRNS